jgi:hypothetical protein
VARRHNGPEQGYQRLRRAKANKPQQGRGSPTWDTGCCITGWARADQGSARDKGLATPGQGRGEEVAAIIVTAIQFDPKS